MQLVAFQRGLPKLRVPHGTSGSGSNVVTLFGWIEQFCFTLQSIFAPEGFGRSCELNWLRNFFWVAQVLCCSCHRNHWLRGSCSAWRWNPRFWRPGMCDCMSNFDESKFGFVVRANVRTQQSPSQLRWPRDRQRSSRDAKMNGNASYFRLPLLFAKHFVLPAVAKILHPHLCVGEDGQGMEQGFSVAGSGFNIYLLCLKWKWNKTPFTVIFSTPNCCSSIFVAPLRSEVVRRETGHMGIFPKQYLRSATDDWMMEKIGIPFESTHFEECVTQSQQSRFYGTDFVLPKKGYLENF